MIAIKAMMTTLVALLLLLVASNRYAVHMMIFGRRHIGLFDRWVSWLETKGGPKFGRVLRKTRPGRMPRRM